MNDFITRSKITQPLPMADLQPARPQTPPTAQPGVPQAPGQEGPGLSSVSEINLSTQASSQSSARTRIGLVGEREPDTSSRRKSRPLTAPLELQDVQPAEIRNYITMLAAHEGSLRIVQLRDQLRQLGDKPAQQLSPSERRGLGSLSDQLLTQLPALRDELELHCAQQELMTLFDSDPKLAAKVLLHLQLIAENGESASSAELQNIVSHEMASMKPEVRARFEALGLSRLEFMPSLIELHRRLAPLQRAVDLAGDKQVSAVTFGPVGLLIAGKEFSSESLGQHLKQAGNEAEAQLALDVMAQQQDTSSLQSGLAQVMKSSNQLEADMHTLLREMQAYQQQHARPGKEVDFSGFKPSMDLSKGNNAILLKLILNAGSFENGKPVISNELRMLQGVLGRFQSEGASALDAADHQLLEQFGIGLRGDKLINLANHRELGEYELLDLDNVMSEIGRSMNENMGSISLMVQKFQTVIKQTKLAGELETAIRDGNRKLAELSKRADETSEAMQRNEDEQKKLQPLLERAAKEYERQLGPLLPFLRDGKLDLDALDGDQKRQARAALAHIGITVDSNGRFSYKGKLCEAEQLDGVVSERIEELSKNFRDLKARRDQLLNEAKALQAQGQQIQQEISAVSSSHASKLEQYEGLIEDIKRTSDTELAALINSPAFQQLSPDVQARYRQAYADRQAVVSRAPAVSAEGRQYQAQAHNSSQRLATRSSSLAGTSELSVHLLDFMPAELLKLADRNLAAAAASLRARVNEAGEAADELERRLSLAPVPKGEELAKLTARWQQELEAIHTLARKHAEQAQALASAASSSEAKFLARMRDQAKHHLEALAQLDQRRADQVQQLLQASLSDLKSLSA